MLCQFHSIYHYDPGAFVQEHRGIVFPHEGQQEALVCLPGTSFFHFNAAEQFTAVAVLAAGVQGQQRHEGRNLEDEVQEHGQGSVQSEGLHRWHGGQGPLGGRAAGRGIVYTLHAHRSVVLLAL